MPQMHLNQPQIALKVFPSISVSSSSPQPLPELGYPSFHGGSRHWSQILSLLANCATTRRRRRSQSPSEEGSNLLHPFSDLLRLQFQMSPLWCGSRNLKNLTRYFRQCSLRDTASALDINQQFFSDQSELVDVHKATEIKATWIFVILGSV